jgi:hypothetical protein
MSMSIVIDVDLEHAPPDVTLRIYDTGRGRRIVRTKELAGLAAEAAAGRGRDGVDGKLLADLHGFLKGRQTLIDGNLAFVKIRADQFAAVRGRWGRYDGRLLDHATQTPIGAGAPVASLEVDLRCAGAKTEVAAFVRAGDTRTAWHKLSGNLTGGDTLRVGDTVYTFRPGVPKTALDKVFGNGAPTVPSQALADNLAAILNHQLQVLKAGVTRTNDKGVLRLDVRLSDALVFVSVDCDGVAVEADERPLEKVRFTGSGFELVTFSPPGLAELRALLAGMTVAPEPSVYQLAAQPMSVSKFRDKLKSLAEVIVEWDPALDELTAGEAEVEPTMTLAQGDGWVDLQLGCRINGVLVNRADLQTALAAPSEMFRTRGGRWLPTPKKSTKTMEALLDNEFGMGTHRLTNVSASRLLKTLKLPNLSIDPESKSLVRRLRRLKDVETAPLESMWDCELRSYQRAGVDFLFNRYGFGVGAILADDMGLGKTRQVLACLAAVGEQSKTPSLVIAPASVVSVWLHEAKRLMPEMRVTPLVGPPQQRRTQLRAKESDLFLATYAVLRNDIKELTRTKLAVVVLDEAQTIKNPESHTARAARLLQANARVAVTGTPLENRLMDLWSIMDFLNPGLLGEAEKVDNRFAGGHGRAELRRRLGPVLLRRTKQEVAPELPPRTEETLYVPMVDNQRTLYDDCLRKVRMQLHGAGAVQMFSELTRLRQICCHPALVADDRDKWRSDRILAESAKLQCLIERLRVLLEGGHSALVFSQFTTMLNMIERQLTDHDMESFKIIGETPVARRAKMVEDFTNSREPSVFLLSLRAAGTGLTLTKADYVFIFDPWWNPAVENQAIDRTHRIGQDKPVFAYRIVAENSVESRVLEMQEQKRQLFSDLIEEADVDDTHVAARDLSQLFG